MTATTDAAPTDADTPGEIPAEGWKAVARRVVGRAKEDNIPLTAGGVAFFAFLSLIPALVALVSIYGLVADPDAIEERVEDLAGALPDEARDLIVQQLEGITAAGGGALTVSLIVALAVALWSASGGMNHLVSAVNIAYHQPETRGFVARRGLSLALLLGALVFAVVAISVITALPSILAAMDLPGVARALIMVGAWLVVGFGLMVGLAVLYRYAPDREPDPNWVWVTPGAAIAVVAWLVASVGFQIYASNFGSYNETYGSLSAVVVMMLWLWITVAVVLVGATVNSETEHQTAVDTTS
ncbi:MAG: YihY/virulence factor BrkB family protein [Acidimicrobiales bacterium]